MLDQHEGHLLLQWCHNNRENKHATAKHLKLIDNVLLEGKARTEELWVSWFSNHTETAWADMISLILSLGNPLSCVASWLICLELMIIRCSCMCLELFTVVECVDDDDDNDDNDDSNSDKSEDEIDFDEFDG